MTIFHLPDLGEGLPEAEIHEWFVNIGDLVEADMPMVSMETAKAVVEVPCPQSGKITKLFGKKGDIIKTGAPLIEFEATSTQQDKGTVVGHLESLTDVQPDIFTVGTTQSRLIITPTLRMLAKKLNVSISEIKGTGDNGAITKLDIESAYTEKNKLPDGYVPFHGARRAMVQSMTLSHDEVVSVSIFDEVCIQTWSEKDDITTRIIAAICHAVKIEPALNAHYHSEHKAQKLNDHVHLGLAMDTDDGLFVPVIHEANTKDGKTLRDTINHLKQLVTKREASPDCFKGATITLSNFGKFAGKFASPIIVPPQVAILAVGARYQKPVFDSNQTVINAWHLPLSLSFDHRAVTGGEATRFLGALISELAK
jgi:2-oxoisovalerate dehydrogenase E2 component (dihydrolipoyl transacylase)